MLRPTEATGNRRGGRRVVPRRGLRGRGFRMLFHDPLHHRRSSVLKWSVAILAQVASAVPGGYFASS
eukprot:3192384-Amphidinium_carterae.2